MTHLSPERLAMQQTQARDESGAIILTHHVGGRDLDPSALAPLTQFGPRAEAKLRASGEDDPHIISAHLDIRNPLWVDDLGEDLIT
ncbi:MAG: hypothetical protein ABJK83_00100, partial [Parasphingorhabdus sp.]